MWYNSIIRWLLRSPLHGLMSKNTMLITYTGRRSGKVYTTPVNYVRDGDELLVTSYRHRTWWRNLRGGAPVILRLRGQDLKGVGEVVEDDENVAASLTAYLQKVPRTAKYFQVALNPDGEPIPNDVTRAAQDRVMIMIRAQLT
jgi:deazaflavin-dependent oxidoreductase (nitroreductase family)